MKATGNLAEMKRYFGTAKLTNLVAIKTRRHEAKRRNQCQGINERSPHTPTADEKPLRFSHNPWRSRLDILEYCLAKYKEGDGPVTPETLYYIPNLDSFEQEFIEEHIPWENSGKILCKTCDREWTVRSRMQQDGWIEGATPTKSPDRHLPKVATIEQLTVELIFQGLSNTDVLAGIRKVFPDRATMNTVRWYRSHLNRDGSPRFEKLRAGRTPPASPR